MPNPSVMTEARFREILEAYGADSKRWPQAERAGAISYMLDHATRVQSWLDEARITDGLLNTLSEADRLSLEDSRSLHWQTLEHLARRMPEDVGNVVVLKPRVRPPVLWAAAGMAACIAGAIFGITFSMSTLADVRAQAVLEQAQVFDDEAVG
ncbi:MULTISPECIES: hypothetical protein [Asticcacaulis]|uniref:hypothetical protein n=1 Tax=Asticcacaulis TaxID=76890 RepID=UPI001AE7955F|nr:MULTISPECIES: hypothetical protein [Asticcacaulis]MBP2157766.1 hypothetical protein [Asticcacaulis solisilvae]MDR6798811.1 hypothetical protein [Asticcacaulis sp. BE141]